MKLNKRSLANLVNVHPELVKIINLAAIETTIDFIIVCGVRTLEEQKSLVASGHSKTMNSRHLRAKNGYSHAIDVACFGEDGKITWDLKRYKEFARFIKRCATALNIPIEWGGDWKTIVDGPHFQLPWKEFPGNK